MNVSKELAKLVTSAREQLGLTQSALAKMCGLSPQFVSKFELGETRISIDYALVMVSVLGIGLKDVKRLIDMASANREEMK